MNKKIPSGVTSKRCERSAADAAAIVVHENQSTIAGKEKRMRFRATWKGNKIVPYNWNVVDGDRPPHEYYKNLQSGEDDEEGGRRHREKGDRSEILCYGSLNADNCYGHHPRSLDQYERTLEIER